MIGKSSLDVNKENLTEDQVLYYFEELLKFEKRDILILPHGSMVKFCKNIIKNNNQNVPFLKSDNKLKISLEVFMEKKFDKNDINFNSKFYFKDFYRSHLSKLEAEAIFIIRDVVAQSSNPVMLYSLGKDSSVMLHLARKAFYPNKPPFPFLHIDTRWKFQNMYEFRDFIVKKYNLDLIIYSNEEGIRENINPIDSGSNVHTHIMKTEALKKALNKFKFDFAFGGARDEGKSRAKERIFQ